VCVRDILGAGHDAWVSECVSVSVRESVSVCARAGVSVCECVCECVIV